MDLRWDVFLGTYYYWRLIKGVPLVSQPTHPPTHPPTHLVLIGGEEEEAYMDLRWDVFWGTYYYWRLIKGVPLVSKWVGGLFSRLIHHMTHPPTHPPTSKQQVPWEFIVPEEAPWPFFCRGVELGKMCDMIRRHQEVRPLPTHPPTHPPIPNPRLRIRTASSSSTPPTHPPSGLLPLLPGESPNPRILRVEVVVAFSGRRRRTRAPPTLQSI